MARRPQQISPDVAAPGAVAPTYLSPQREARIEGVDAGAFGANLGRGGEALAAGMSRAGSTLSTILIQEQALENETNATRRATETGNALNEQWAAYSQLQGQDAVAGWQAYRDGIQARVRDTLDGTANPAERRLLERSLSQHAAQLERGGMQWRAQQQRVASVNASNAATALQINNAVIARDNPQQVDEALRAIDTEVLKIGEVEGWNADQLRVEQDRRRGAALNRVVSSIAETDPLRAQAVFNQYRDRLDADSQVAIAQHLRQPVINRRASDMVAEVLQPAGSARDRIFRAENAAGDARRNPNSTASGPGQITDGMWSQYADRLGLTAAQRNDRGAHERIFDAFQSDMARDIGRPLNDGEQYAAWFLGGGAFKAFLSAGRDADARQVYTRATNESMAQRAFSTNGSLLRDGMTVGQVMDAVAARVGPGSGARTDRAAAMQEIVRRTANEPELQSAALSRLQQQFHLQDTMNSQERAALNHRVQQTSAALQIGQTVEIPEAELRRVLPPAEAEHQIGRLRTDQISGQMYAAAQFASPEQIAAMQADIVNAPGSTPGPLTMAARAAQGIRTNADGSVVAEDVARDVATREALRVNFEQRVATRNQQLRADPAQYVAADPTVAAAARRQAENPGDAQALQGYVTASLDAQRRLGLSDAETRVLSKTTSQQMAARLMRGDPSNESFTAAAQLQGMARQYGEQWPRVFADLVRDGRLPDDYRVLAAIDGPTGQNDFQRMLMTAQRLGGMDKIRAAGDQAQQRLVRDQVQQYVEPFLRTVNAGTSSGGAALGAMVTEAVSNLASFYIMQGQSAATALQGAADRIINDKYEIMGTMRVPRTLPNGQPLGLQPVMQAQAVVMRGLTADMLADVPGNPELTPAERRDTMLRAAQNGQWVPNERDDGLVLVATYRNGLRLPVQMAGREGRIEIFYNALPRPEANLNVLPQRDSPARGVQPIEGFNDVEPGAAAARTPNPVTMPVGPRPQPGAEPRGARRPPARWRGENAQ